MSQINSVDWYNSIDAEDLDDLKLDFAVAVERALERSGKRKIDLARELRVSAARITKVLSGDANLTMEVMHNIATALDHRVSVSLTPACANGRWANVITSENAPVRAGVSTSVDQLIFPDLKLAA